MTNLRLKFEVFFVKIIKNYRQKKKNNWKTRSFQNFQKSIGYLKIAIILEKLNYIYKVLR